MEARSIIRNQRWDSLTDDDFFGWIGGQTGPSRLEQGGGKVGGQVARFGTSFRTSADQRRSLCVALYLRMYSDRG